MKNRGFHRQTRQRQVILDELRKSRQHPTAAELHELVRKQLPRISLGTVYRNLEILTRNGTIRKLEQSGSGARYDGDMSRHYHIRCSECGTVADVRVPSSVLDEDTIEAPAGYKLLGHRLEFKGLCPECRRGRSGTHSSISRSDREEKQRGMQAGDSR